jgi:signal transduction histidine kinase
MTDALLTPAARRFVAAMARSIAPDAGRLDRRFRKILRARGYNAAQIRAFLAITPSAAARLRSLSQFLEQVQYNGRRLAKLNVQPASVDEVLREFGQLLDSLLENRFQPAREQLYLSTTMALGAAYYQVREAEAQAFFDLVRAEAESSGLEDLLRRFVRILTRTFRARAGHLLLLRRPAGGKFARPLYIERGNPEEQLLPVPALRGRFASYWSFPMGQLALLQFGFAVPYAWLPRELDLLNAVAERCQAAIEKVRLEAENRRLEAEARQAEEDERRRIGRELHDEAGQLLLLLRLELEMMERQASEDLLPRVVEARRMAERTVDEIRRIVAALSPAVLERLGLEAALRQLGARFRKLHPARLRMQISGSWQDLPRPPQEVIYRVSQESLQNIVKHSQATHVNLSLMEADKSIRLSVTDNGTGFSAEAAPGKPMSFGLAGMQERARLLGGKLNVCSRPGKGVAVRLVLPKDAATVVVHGKNTRTLN